MTDIAKPNFQETLNRYSALMRELKIRISSIEKALNGQTGLPEFLVQEFCFLQLRMSCEIIALGCLIAHGDKLPGSITLREEHSASAIMTGLEKLHSDFYPVPSKNTKTEDGIVHFDEDIQANGITKKELIELNGRCGRYLHRGTRNSLFGVKPRRRTVHFSIIANHAQRILNLLSLHAMLLADEETVFFCALETETSASVLCWIAR